jgi:stringent starvation protein B
MPPLPAKKDVLLALLERSSVYVHFDPRDETVRVPPWFKKQPQLVLQIGLNMAVPIRDLSVDDDAVSGTLSFSRSPHFCYMPWSAVYALIGEDSRGMVWPEDIPPEVMAQKAGAGRPSKKTKLRAVPAKKHETKTRKQTPGRSKPRPAASPPPPRGKERPEDPAERTPPDAEAALPEATGGKARPPYLRVVK